jgi:hypothetical protein
MGISVLAGVAGENGPVYPGTAAFWAGRQVVSIDGPNARYNLRTLQFAHATICARYNLIVLARFKRGGCLAPGLRTRLFPTTGANSKE